MLKIDGTKRPNGLRVSQKQRATSKLFSDEKEPKPHKEDEQISKIRKMQGADSPKLQIVHWGQENEKKLLDFVCFSERAPEAPQEAGQEQSSQGNFGGKAADGRKLLGSVHIRIFENRSGEKVFEFSFDFADNFSCESKKSRGEEQFCWRNEKGAADFKMSLNPPTTFLFPNKNEGIARKGEEPFAKPLRKLLTKKSMKLASKSSFASNAIGTNSGASAVL